MSLREAEVGVVEEEQVKRTSEKGQVKVSEKVQVGWRMFEKIVQQIAFD